MFRKYNFETLREIECDTFVAGGGVAGSSAAIASEIGTAACDVDATVLRKKLILDGVCL